MARKNRPRRENKKQARQKAAQHSEGSEMKIFGRKKSAPSAYKYNYNQNQKVNHQGRTTPPRMSRVEVTDAIALEIFGARYYCVGRKPTEE